MRQFGIFIFFIFVGIGLSAQTVIVTGCITDSETQQPVQNAIVKFQGSGEFARSNRFGKFRVVSDRESLILEVSHLAYKKYIKAIHVKKGDSLNVDIVLKQKANLLNSVPITANHKPETLISKPDYSIHDFDFAGENFILLTSEKSMNKAQVRLSDYEGNILATYNVPSQAREAQSLFRDYEGYTDLICKDSIFRLDVMNRELMVMPIPKKAFYRYIKPIADSLNNTYYYSDAWDKYPQFTYYYIRKNDTVSHPLNTVTNERLLDLYNFEYYFLPPHLQLEARRIEQYEKIDHHVAAALMSGFTDSFFYEALYAPLVILKDTICIFNHYTDHLYHYNKNNMLIDSIKISYHHPKNWRDWKRKLLVDEMENKVYAYFSKNGHHYLKNIDCKTGKEKGTYQLKFHSADKIKVRDGYAYYVYRPFGSTQEKFLYREKIVFE